MKGKLNIPQRTVLLWDEIHPYNAVHVVRVPEPLELGRLKDTVKRCLEIKGLTGLEVDRRRKRFHFKGGSVNTEIEIIEGQGDPIPVLCGEVQKQLNTPFDKSDSITPFRFFTVTEERSFYLGIVYYHLISGGDSIVYLLKSIVRSYIDGNSQIPDEPLNLYQRSLSCLPLLNPKRLFKWVYSLPGHISDLRASFRPRYSDYNDQSVGFAYFSIGAPQFQPLIKKAKGWGVTLNDVFIAIILKTLSPLAEERRLEPRRKKLSVVSSVNIRRDLALDDCGKFGMFLGSFNISHSVPEGIPVEDLAKDIHLRTEKIKRDKLYLGTILDQALALFLLTFFFRKRRNNFYSKNYPLCGGISNINLNTIWDQTEDKALIDYFRAVSTGPVTPLVFSLTTVKDVLNVGVSYRKTVFSKDDIAKIISDYSKYISNPDIMQT
jgi:hypothetical protein